MTLSEYVIDHTVRGECQCGRCIDKGSTPDPTGHTADLFFFKVATANAPDVNTLRDLIATHAGAFTECAPLDGREHGYIELGAWLGDQGLAMQFMGLCHLLGLCRLYTPNSVMQDLDENLKTAAAAAGLVTIQA
jgi:hypothetical protein